jgi:hypothetical protein
VNALSRLGKIGALGLVLAVVVLGLRLSLPIFGTALTVDDPIETADVALVLEGTGKDAPDVAEMWRTQGLVHDVVIVEAPVKTHALVAYWSDFVRWGLAASPPTPADHLQVVRAPSTQAAEQAQAALAAVQRDAARRVLIPGGGGIGSRLVERELVSIFGPAGIDIRLVRYGQAGRDPANWYQNADDRRAVLDSWLQLLVPFLSGYEPGAGT